MVWCNALSRRSRGSVGLHWEMFRLRAGYFPKKESSQSSPGLRARTQESASAASAIAAGAGDLLKGIAAYSLPLSSISGASASTCLQCAWVLQYTPIPHDTLRPDETAGPRARRITGHAAILI